MSKEWRHSPVPCNQAHCKKLENQITELAAHIHAATYRLLELNREYDDSRAWAGPGMYSCAHWLAELEMLHQSRCCA